MTGKRYLTEEKALTACLACMEPGAETGLSFLAAEAGLVAGLVRLGIPQDEAAGMVATKLAQRPRNDVGLELLGVRVCTGCAAAAGFAVGPVADGIEAVPAYSMEAPNEQGRN